MPKRFSHCGLNESTRMLWSLPFQFLCLGPDEIDGWANVHSAQSLGECTLASWIYKIRCGASLGTQPARLVQSLGVGIQFTKSSIHKQQRAVLMPSIGPSSPSGVRLPRRIILDSI